jgi:PAS domain S-box-containing protein
MVKKAGSKPEQSSKRVDAEKFFQRTNELLAVCDSDGKFLRLNSAWTTVLGYQPEELINQQAENLLHPDNVAETRFAVREVWRGRKVGHLQAHVVAKDGRDVWLDWSAVADLDERLFYLTCHDITERKLLEQDWANTSAALENAVEGIARVDTYGRFTAVNPAFAEHLGYRPEDLLGAHWHISVHPEDVPILKSAEEEMLANGKAELEARGIKRDGNLSHSQIVLVKALDESNNYMGHHCFMKDISARKEAELSLKKTELRLAGLLRHVPGVLYQLIVPDRKTVYFSYVSESCAHILGYEPNEFIENAMLIYRCLHPEDVAPLRQLMVKSAKEMQSFRTELRCCKRTGEILWVLLSSSPEKLETGELVWNGLITDITELKMAEEKIKQLNEDLAQRIQVLATVNEELETLTRKLEIAYGQAMEASKVKSEFVANISHEVRTPISAVIGMSELLIDSPLNPEQEQLAKIISESAQSLLTIINDILDFSKMEAGRIELESINFSIPGIVKECTDWLKSPAAEKSLQLLTEIDPALPTLVKGDPLRIRQVLLNLATNAIKFTAHGHVKVSVNLLNKSEGSITVRFEVQDTGIGLAETARKRLFKPFSQADGSTTRKYGGTGLGLSICKHLVELMGGEIGVESQAGAGSTFWFKLPLLVCDAIEPVEEAPDHDTTVVQLKRAADIYPVASNLVDRFRHYQPSFDEGLQESPARAGSSILLAEDNQVLQELTVRQLHRLGVKVDVVNNGREAVDAVTKNNYDLILMDCQMPEMDGFEATAEIRKEESQNGKKNLIVALTASAMASDREHCLECGMDDYLAKPVRLRQLVEVIDKWIPANPTAAGATFKMGERGALLQSMTEPKPTGGTGGNTKPNGIDLDALKGMYGEDSTHEILTMFLDETCGLFDQMKGELTRRENTSLAASAHQLKGVSASVVAQHMSRLAAQLETAAKQPNWTEAEQLLTELTNEMSSITIFVKQELDRHGEP